MQSTKRKKLEAQGWKVGTVAEFLDLDAVESAYIEMKLALSNALRQRRLKSNLSQIEFARLVKSSQSRVAKMEAGDASVSVDLLMWSLLVLGVTPKELAKTITTASPRQAP